MAPSEEARLIAVTGRKQHGKSAIADYLFQRGFQVCAFADPIKHMLREGLGLSLDQTDGHLKEVIDSRYGVTPRHLMQTLGTEWGRKHVRDDLWVRLLIARARALHNAGYDVAVADVRFPNEAAALRAAGFSVWKVVRPGLPAAPDTHESEAHFDAIEADHIFINDKSLDELLAAVRTLMKES